jgi:thioester reductase-like protein
MGGVYFMTGVSGFLGQEILELLAKKNQADKFYCLIREAKEQRSEDRLRAILSDIGLKEDGRILAVNGDMRRDQLGIEDAVYRRLTTEVTQIVHSAADVRFNQPLEKIRAINVQGTKSICEFARACKEHNPAFSHLNYIGTAFVAGKRTGMVKEGELTDEFGFKNTYEQTKYEAERLVRSYREDGLPVMIFRPSIVVGVSETGKAKPRNVIYPMLKYFSQWSFPVVSVNTEARLDIVPVDFVAKAFVHIASNRENIGKCFHLTAGPQGNINLKEMLKITADGLNKKVVIVPQRIWATLLRPIIKIVRPSLYKNSTLPAYRPYIWWPSPIYSVEETEEALKGSGIRLPDEERFLKNCVRYAVETDFGSKPAESTDS